MKVQRPKIQEPAEKPRYKMVPVGETQRVPVDDNGHPEEAIPSRLESFMCQVMWALRFKITDFSVHITPDDIEGFKQALAYTKQRPKIEVNETQSGIFVRMCDARGNGLIQAENTEDKMALRDRLKAVKELAATVPSLIDQHRQMDAAGTTSSGLNNELYSALQTMAAALR